VIYSWTGHLHLVPQFITWLQISYKIPPILTRICILLSISDIVL